MIFPFFGSLACTGIRSQVKLEMGYAVLPGAFVIETRKSAGIFGDEAAASVWFYKKVANHRDRPLIPFALIWFVLIALLLPRATAAVHPVPLDKNIDAAKCLECHEDKSKGKFVHSAIAMDRKS